MQFISDSFIIIHSFALAFFLLIIFTYDLHPFVGTLAYIIITFNIVCLFTKWYSEKINSFVIKIKDSLYRKRDLEKQKVDNQRLSRFKKLVNEASNRMIGANPHSFQCKNFWKMSTSRKNENISQLRKLKLSDLNQFSNRNTQSYVYRSEGRLSKRIRAFLMQQRCVLSHQKQTQKNRQAQSRQMNKVLSALVQQFKKEKKSLKDSKPSIQRQNPSKYKHTRNKESESIQNCLKIIAQLIETKIQNEIDTIIDDMELIDKFLQRGFSIHFTLQQGDRHHMAYDQVKQLIQIIQVKSVLPQRYTPNVSFLEIKKEAHVIKEKIFKLPNFCLASNIIRLVFGLAYLRKEFPEDSITIADMRGQSQQMNKARRHLVRTLNDDRMFYNNFPEIKTRSSSVIIFLIIFEIIRQEGNKNSSLIKKIRSQLQI